MNNRENDACIISPKLTDIAGGSPSTDSRTADYLAGLLSFALRRGAGEAARELVDRYGTLDRIVATSASELASIPHMTENAAILLHLGAALSSRRVTDGLKIGSVPTEEELFGYLIALYIGTPTEVVHILLFNEGGELVACENMGEGTVNGSDIYPRRLLEHAVKHHATSAILVHNHPRASCTSSAEDVTTTKILAGVFRSAGVTLRAHYIVAGRSIASVPFAD